MSDPQTRAEGVERLRNVLRANGLREEPGPAGEATVITVQPDGSATVVEFTEDGLTTSTATYFGPTPPEQEDQ